MPLRTLALAAALALAAPLAPAPVLAGVTVSGDYLETDYDVAGVQLGMLETEAFDALTSRGYVLDEQPNGGTQRGPSWSELVAIQAGELDAGSATESWSRALFRNGQEGVLLHLKPLPTGTAVSRILYVSMAPTMTADRFYGAVEGKYGKPAFSSSAYRRWSDMPLIGGDSFDSSNGAVMLEAKDGFPNRDGSWFQQVKGSIALSGGRIGDADPEALAKDWTPEPATTF